MFIINKIYAWQWIDLMFFYIYYFDYFILLKWNKKKKKIKINKHENSMNDFNVLGTLQ
jgi:Ca2+/Na+ antiporter